MLIDTNNMVSITEANQNFSRVARIADRAGAVLILKNNAPRYVLLEFSKLEQKLPADSEELSEISRRIMEANSEAYTELSK